ncbi:MAG: quinohemoprotein amine dehydrogenase maturation protein [Azoarcus sp.]|jgi:uncharacterized protein|nr:quinohemoprotein amine dehydrogenase maturation protein [Azoarcus sp.]
MPPLLSLVEHNLHEVRVRDERLLFHVPSSSLFAIDRLAASLIDALREEGRSARQLTAHLGRLFSPVEIEETLAELMALELVSDGGPRPAPPPPKIDRFPLSTLALNVNTGCNLACSYCYKADLATPAAGRKMSFETAREAIELMLREAPDEKRYHISFFGGEPLTRRTLIEKVVDYCETRFASLGKEHDFVMTTNATLLNDEIIDWLDAHAFGLSISIDGPRAIHDRNRRTVGGFGTYETVRAKAERLLARYRSRPVGARVTLTAGVTDVEAIWDHLKNELGFAEVGFAPVTSGDAAAFNLSADELKAVFAAFKRLGEHYIAEALAGRNIGFSNLHQLLTDLHEGHKKRLPCGAGMKMLAIDHEGGLHLCHRFTGSGLPTFGNVRDGIRREALGDFLSARLARPDAACTVCRIRNLCAGGCYHESHVRYGDPVRPVHHYCAPMRGWADFGITAYARIMARNPGFIDSHLMPRRPR